MGMVPQVLEKSVLDSIKYELNIACAMLTLECKKRCKYSLIRAGIITIHPYDQGWRRGRLDRSSSGWLFSSFWRRFFLCDYCRNDPKALRFLKSGVLKTYDLQNGGKSALAARWLF